MKHARGHNSDFSKMHHFCCVSVVNNLIDWAILKFKDPVCKTCYRIATSSSNKTGSF